MTLQIQTETLSVAIIPAVAILNGNVSKQVQERPIACLYAEIPFDLSPEQTAGLLVDALVEELAQDGAAREALMQTILKHIDNTADDYQVSN